MDPVRISVTITGTDDNGDTRNWAATGQIECSGVFDGNLTATTSHQKILDGATGGDQVPAYVYVENYGDNDIAFGHIDDNGLTSSHTIPSGASLFMKLQGAAGSIYSRIDEIEIWTQTGTSEVRYLFFY